MVIFHASALSTLFSPFFIFSHSLNMLLFINSKNSFLTFLLPFCQFYGIVRIEPQPHHSIFLSILPKKSRIKIQQSGYLHTSARSSCLKTIWRGKCVSLWKYFTYKYHITIFECKLFSLGKSKQILFMNRLCAITIARVHKWTHTHIIWYRNRKSEKCGSISERLKIQKHNKFEYWNI